MNHIMNLSATTFKFTQIQKRWAMTNLVIILIHIMIYLLFTLTYIIRKDKSGIIFMFISAILVFSRFFIIPYWGQLKRINHIIKSIEYGDNISIQTFPISALFGLIKQGSICLTIPKTALKVSVAPKHWPLLKKNMRSENNYLIDIGSEQFYALRALFENSQNFDQCIHFLSV